MKAAKIPPVNVTNQKLADGVWFLAGGTHNSVLVEFPDYAVMIESPLNDARAAGVMAEAKKLVPGEAHQVSDQYARPLRPPGRCPLLCRGGCHGHHPGGEQVLLRAGLEGAAHARTRITWRRVRRRPASSRSKTSTSSAMEDGRSMFIASPATLTMSVMSMVYMPKEKILVEADDFTPAPPNAPSPGTSIPCRNRAVI